MTRVRGLVTGWAGPLAVVAGVMFGTTGCVPPSMDPAVSVDPIERLGRKAVRPQGDMPGTRAGGVRPGPGAEPLGPRSGRSGGSGAVEALPGAGARKIRPGAGVTRSGAPGPPAHAPLPAPVRKAARETPAAASVRPVRPGRSRAAARPGPHPSAQGMRAPALTESTTRLLDRIHRVRSSPARLRQATRPARPYGRTP